MGHICSVTENSTRHCRTWHRNLIQTLILRLLSSETILSGVVSIFPGGGVLRGFFISTPPVKAEHEEKPEPWYLLMFPTWKSSIVYWHSFCVQTRKLMEATLTYLWYGPTWWTELTWTGLIPVWRDQDPMQRQDTNSVLLHEKSPSVALKTCFLFYKLELYFKSGEKRKAIIL